MTETSERVVAVCARIIVALIGLIAGHVYSTWPQAPEARPHGACKISAELRDFRVLFAILLSSECTGLWKRALKIRRVDGGIRRT